MKYIFYNFAILLTAITMVSCRDCEYEVEYSAAALWKNGVKQELPYGDSPGYLDIRTYSIFVSENNVYVAGCERGDGIAIIWKNGIAEVFTDVKAQQTSVYVSGNDIYFIGSNTVWKNNEIIQTLEGTATSVYVVNNEVYVAGYIYKENKRIATIWINGVAQYLTDGATYSYANSIFVSDGDIYVAGIDDRKSTLWRNGVPQTLPGGSKANIVFVSNNDVYVGGDSKVWKNGNIEYNIDGSATSIFVSKNDVYVTTEYSVLKNGVVIQETDLRPDVTERSYFTSVFVSGNDVYVAGFYYKRVRVCS